MEVVQTRALSKVYGKKRAVDELSMTVHEGDIYGFIGKNGAGKSTALKMLCSLAAPTSGEIAIFGRPVTDSVSRKRTGILIESPGIYPGLGAEDNMMQKAVCLGLVDGKKKVRELLSLVGLSDTGKKKTKQFSMGMKQRLGIARAILAKPELLILDEPTNGLDPLGMKQIRDLLRMLCEEYGITILISSHLLSEIENVAHTIGIMNHGKLLQEISMDAITDQNFAYIELLVSDVKKAAYVLDEKLGINNFKILDVNVIRIYDVSISVERVSKVLAENNVGIEGVTKKQDTLEDYFLKLTRE